MNQNISISVCSGGWNARDSLDSMPITDAIIYDNVVYDAGRDKVRNGYKKVINTGSNTIFSHTQENNKRIIAVSDGKIRSYSIDNYELKLENDIVGSVYKYCQFVDGGGNLHSIITNNTNKVYNFTVGDSDSLSEIEFTNEDGSAFTKSLTSPFSYKNRLYFIEKDSFNIVYTGVQSYQGTVKEFGVNSFFKNGGKIIKAISWTQDGGDGTDDQLCIFTDMGEVLVYSGISPESDDWALKGRYEIPRPINDKCIKQVKGDIVIATVSGYMMLSSVLSSFSAQSSALSNKINSVIEDKKSRFNDSYWDCVYYANDGKLIFNAPSVESSLNYEWHVYNTKNNTWSRYLGQNSLSFCCIGDDMYFSNGSGIYKDNIGTTDNGFAIKFRIHHAYSDFGIKQKKKINRLILRSKSVNIEDLYKFVWCDYKETAKTFIRGDNYTNQELDQWDTGVWDSARWSDVAQVNTVRAGVAHLPATYISFGFWGSTKTETSIFGADLMLVSGNGVI